MRHILFCCDYFYSLAVTSRPTFNAMQSRQQEQFGCSSDVVVDSGSPDSRGVDDDMLLHLAVQHRLQTQQATTEELSEPPTPPTRRLVLRNTVPGSDEWWAAVGEVLGGHFSSRLLQR